MRAPKKKPGERRYRVTGEITISVSTLVWAKDETEARKKTIEVPVMNLCHQCATGEDTVEWVTSGDLDGEVTVTGAEEEEE